jgi:hypothetical protein
LANVVPVPAAAAVARCVNWPRIHTVAVAVERSSCWLLLLLLLLFNAAAADAVAIHYSDNDDTRESTN